MASKKAKKEKPTYTDRRISSKNMRRVLMLAGAFGIFTFVILFGKLWKVQIVDHEKLQGQAITQQTREVSSRANRGTIYDTNGNIMAISASVQNVILSPRDVLASVKVSDKDEFGNPRSDVAIEAEKKQQIQNKYDLIADGLSKILGVDRDDVVRRLNKTNSAWEQVATKIEDDLADQVRQFILKNDLTGCLYLTTDSKRYYPYNAMASQVIGFVNSDNKGAYGLESIYNSDLSGEDGQIITAKNASGTEMLSNYESYTNAVNGYDLHLTLDTTIQHYAEQTVEEGIQKFDVSNGAFCIVMQPKTGAILAMVSYPNYDLNNPNEIIDTTEIAKLAKLKQNKSISDEEYQKAVQTAQFAQWRNKALNDTYEPGSTFKPIVVASALEEGVVNENSTFYCSGQVTVGGWVIRCSKRTGHGLQNLRQAVMNSCNPALIAIGQKLGAVKFYQYLEDFGLTEKTDIQLQGESKSNLWKKDEFISPAGITSLATASFGQRFQITPIQLITAISAVINGGHLMEPYAVQSVTDSDGNVVSYHEAKQVRQVISQKTSDTVRSIMESVVGDGGTGKNAYIPGYRIGGKTGTSQTVGGSSDRLIVSFVGFAPADDPEVVVLLAYDWPTPAVSGGNNTASGTYISGGNMAAPMAGELIANILDYLGYQKEGTASSTDVTVPKLSGMTEEEAKSVLSNLSLKYKTEGDGETVTDQAPSSGSSVPEGSTIVLYKNAAKSETTVPMPDLSGMTYNAAKAALEKVGLYLKATGAGTTGKVFSQSAAAGTEVTTGTVVEVKFTDDSVQDIAD